MINLYVNTNGNDNNDGLTIENPKSTITAALNLCVANNEEYIINVASGIYTEYLNSKNTNFKKISIIGENKETTTINGGMAIYFLEELKNLTINVAASNITIYSGYSYSKTILIDNCIINGTGDKLFNDYTSSYDLSILRNSIKNTTIKYTGSLGYIFPFVCLNLDNVSYNVDKKLLSTSIKDLTMNNMQIDSTMFYNINITNLNHLDLNSCNISYVPDIKFLLEKDKIGKFNFIDCTPEVFEFRLPAPTNSNAEYNKYQSSFNKVKDVFDKQENGSRINNTYYSFQSALKMNPEEEILNVTLQSYIYGQSCFISRFYIDEIRSYKITIPIQAFIPGSSGGKIGIGIYKGKDRISWDKPIESISIKHETIQNAEITFTPDEIGEYFIVFNNERGFQPNSGEISFKIKQISVEVV